MKLIDPQSDRFGDGARLPETWTFVIDVDQQLICQRGIEAALRIDHLSEEAQALRLAIEDTQTNFVGVAFMEFP